MSFSDRQFLSLPVKMSQIVTRPAVETWICYIHSAPIYHIASNVFGANRTFPNDHYGVMGLYRAQLQGSVQLMAQSDVLDVNQMFTASLVDEKVKRPIRGSHGNIHEWSAQRRDLEI